ncbi:MAG: tetratricopeptide repeat protein [Candidatus Kryptoniota bacterium]
MSVPLKYIVSFLSLILWTQPGQFTRAQSRNSSTNLDEVITSILHDTYDCKYNVALDETDKLIMDFPDEPEGYLYKSGVYWKMMEEGCVGSSDSTKMEIRALIDKACELSQQKLQSDPNDIMTHFYYAGSLAYRAGYEGMNHDWFAVMSDGIKAKRILERTIELDPNFYDAYSGLGAFNYYTAHIPWYLKPLAFVLGVNGNENEGIAQLEKAAQFGKYAKIEAEVFLASVVYAHQEAYSNALKIMLDLHRQFPDNLDFLRQICHDYYEIRNYAEVIRFAGIALAMDDSTGSCHLSTLCYIRFCRGESYEELNEKSKAIADYEIVTKLNGQGYSGKEAKEALDKLRSQ